MIICTQSVYVSMLNDMGQAVAFRLTTPLEQEASSRFFLSDKDGNADRSRECDATGKLLEGDV